MRRILILFSIITAIFITSCKKDDVVSNDIPTNKNPYFISNEGAFGFGNSSLSLFYPDSNTIINQVFESVNERKPGDVMQSICKAGNELFLIINASNKIEVANSTTLKEISTISNLSLPRYMVADNQGQGYISCWGETGVVKVIDLATKNIIKTIPVGPGPEKMLIHDNYLAICCSGGYGNDSILMIFEIATYNLKHSITVGDNPVDIVMADSSNAWVLCRGAIEYNGSGQIISESAAKIVKVNIISGNILHSEFLSQGLHPSHLEISPDKKTLYFGAGFGFSGIFEYEIENQIIAQQPLISEDFYGFNINPETGDIFALSAPSFTAAGKLKIYDSQGNLKNTFNTGIGPNEVVFK